MELSLLADHPHEIRKIAQWYYDEWLSAIPDITIDRISEKISQSGNRKKIPLFILAHINNQLAGVVELKFRENKNYPEYTHWLGGLFVNPSYRGNGISHILIKEAKKYAIKLGVVQLYLQCESYNIALYEKHNFSILHKANHGEIPVTIMLWSKNT
jgi:putative hydrolase of the HAD superfamily